MQPRFPSDGPTGAELDLSGSWEFLPRDTPFSDLPGRLPEDITVPGLWEAQGHLDLDGPAWYRRRFSVEDTSGHWSLSFGAVMDTAEVLLNGRLVGEHDGAYTPFSIDVTDALRTGPNVLEVRVRDHRVDSPEHRRRAHGKQGWMNGYFPSPPSLYLTYGGIWQPVVLRRHDAVTIADVHLRCDPADFHVTVELANSSGAAVVTVTLDVLGRLEHRTVPVPGGGLVPVRFALGPVDGALWRPENPTLHPMSVVVATELDEVDRWSGRVGLRTVTVGNGRFVLNGEPLFLRGALVQGFRADTLYAEGTREQITAEVLAAQQAGFTLLRLHIKAFDPLYLDVCDELGMLVHADIPVAEPIAHDELGASGEVAEHSARAVTEQIRRDRNHPSLVLWSLMNELGLEGRGARASDGYEAFARLLYDTASALDPTRPIIENDWIDPDPDRVFRSPILTAHWYGRLSSRYLVELADKVGRHSGGDRPLYVSEFGDWGLPSPESSGAPPFWWAGDRLADAIARLPWAGTPASFVLGTQRYQGISDRLQGEIVRARGAAGWCVTELTDVPQEYNGLWSLLREAKTPAIEELSRLCQPVLPIALRTSWTVETGVDLALPMCLSNEGPDVDEAELVIAIDGEPVHRLTTALPGYRSMPLPVITIPAPAVAGDRELTLTVLAGSVASNSYPLRVVAVPRLSGSVSLIGTPSSADLLRGCGLDLDEQAPILVIGENSLDAQAGRRARAALAAGRIVAVLSQPASAAADMPVDVDGIDIATEWGSTPFVFTTDVPGLTALPPNRVLTTEALSITPEAVWSGAWPGRTWVGLFKPYPGQITGTVVGQLPVGPGTLFTCQLPLTTPALADDAAARSVLADLLGLALALARDNAAD